MNNPVRLLVALCALITVFAMVLAAAAAVVLNKAGGVSGLASSRTMIGACAALLCGASAVAATCFLAFRRRSTTERRAMLLGAGVTALIVLLLLAATEASLRRSAVATDLSVRTGGLELLPYDWRQARSTSRLWLERARGRHAVLDAPDPDLGWDLGKARRSADGMYATSVEGVRSADPHDVLAFQQPRYRIALLGDSFTFGEEVTFEDTWGRQLEQMLPRGAQVLNFGVPSHGLDQTLLKFRRDVRRWKPRVTVLSFLNASPSRNTNIYLILRPDQRLPFTKPRFLLRDGALQLLNAPVLSPDSVLAHPSIWMLPWLDHDSRFLATQWSASPLGDAYVARWLFSRFPRWPPPDAGPSAREVVQLAVRIIEQLVAEIHASGSHALIVSLPVREDLEGQPTPWRDAVIEQLARRDIAVFDMNPCLMSRVSLDEGFMRRDSASGAQINSGAAHYSPRGNTAVAACLQPAVSTLLDVPSGEPLSSSVSAAR